MKKLIAIYAAILISGQAFAGGSMGGTPPALSLIGNDFGIGGGKRLPGNYVGLKLIPLPEDTIRRLKVRAGDLGIAPLTLPSGESFRLQKDVENRLVDIEKAVLVIEELAP